jgi:hypothetical protein
MHCTKKTLILSLLAAGAIAAAGCSSEEGDGMGGGGGGNDGSGGGGGTGEGPGGGGDGGDGSGGGGDGGGGFGGLGDGPLAFRLDTLDIRDPHMVAVGIDATTIANDLIKQKMTADGDGDGNIDFALVTLVEIGDISDLSNLQGIKLSIYTASCPVSDPTNCAAKELVSSVDGAEVVTSGSCLDPLEGTTSSYSPPIETSTPPCLKGGPIPSVETEVPGVTKIKMSDSSFTSGFDLNDLSKFRGGMLMGFVNEAAANEPLGAEVPLVAGQPLSSVLPVADQDQGPNGETGWWFYMNISGTRVNFSM